MKNILIGLAFFFILLSGFSQSGDYLVTLKGDTLKGELKDYDNKLKNFKFVEKTISKVDFDATNTSYVFLRSMNYKRILLKTKLTKKLSPNLLHLIYEKGKYSIFEQVYKVVVGDKYIVETIVRNYYICEGENPITEFDELNYKKILPKYFSNCGRLQREIEHNRKLTMLDAINLLTNFCK